MVNWVIYSRNSNYSFIWFNLIYFQKPSDHVDGLVDEILQHVPGVINATSSAIGLIADRLFPICGDGSINQRADSSNGESRKRAGNKRGSSPCSDREEGSSLPRKPLAMELYKPKRKRVSRLPKPQSSSSRKPRSVILKRDANGKFINFKSTSRVRATETSTKDTTRTPVPSEQVHKSWPSPSRQPLRPPISSSTCRIKLP